jgi:hypothetical protein
VTDRNDKGASTLVVSKYTLVSIEINDFKKNFIKEIITIVEAKTEADE